MTREQVDSAFARYRENTARCALLRGQIEQCEKVLRELESNVEEAGLTVTAQLSHAPRSGLRADRTASLASALADGGAPRCVLEVREDIRRMRSEVERRQAQNAAVDACLLAMTEPEALIVRRRVIDGMPWRDAAEAFEERFGLPVSRTKATGLYRRGMERAYAVAR